MNERLDAVIRQVYGVHPMAVDEIVCDPDVAAKFASDVQATATAETRVILRRLMTLRKRGTTENGLSKKHH